MKTKYEFECYHCKHIIKLNDEDFFSPKERIEKGYRGFTLIFIHRKCFDDAILTERIANIRLLTTATFWYCFNYDDRTKEFDVLGILMNNATGMPITRAEEMHAKMEQEIERNKRKKPIVFPKYKPPVFPKHIYRSSFKKYHEGVEWV